MTTGDVKATAPVARPSFTAMAGIGFAMLLPLAASVIQAGLLINKLPVEEHLSIKESRDADTKAVYTPPDGSLSEVIIQRPIRHEVTLNRKLSEASVSEALFRNAGTAPCSITVARPDSENNPELVMVTMTPQGKGTVQLALTEKPPDNLKSLYDHDVDVGSTEPTGKKRLSVADHVADEFRYHKSWARPKEEVAYQVKFRRPVKTADMNPGIFRNALDDVKTWNPEKPAAKLSVVKIKPDSEPFSDSFTVVMKAEASEGKERGYARLEIVNDAVLRDSSGTEIPRAGPIQAEQELAISPEEPGTVLAKLELVPPVNVAAVGQKVLAKLTFASSINPASINPCLFMNKEASGPDIAVKIDASDERTVDLSFVCDKPGKVRLGMKRMVIPGPKGFPLEARIEDTKPIDIIEGGLMVKAFNPKKRIIEGGGSVDYRIEFNKPVSTKQFNAQECVSNDRPGKIKVVNVNPAQEGKELVIRVTPEPDCKVIYLKISKDSELQDPNGVKLKMNIDQVDPLGVVVGATIIELVPPKNSGDFIMVGEPFFVGIRNLPKDVNLQNEMINGKIQITNKPKGERIPSNWITFEFKADNWLAKVQPKIPGSYDFCWDLIDPLRDQSGQQYVLGKDASGGKVTVAEPFALEPTKPSVTSIKMGDRYGTTLKGIPKQFELEKAFKNKDIWIMNKETNERIPVEWLTYEWSEEYGYWQVYINPTKAGVCDLYWGSKSPWDINGKYYSFNNIPGGKFEVTKPPMDIEPTGPFVLVVADTTFLRRNNDCKKAISGMVQELGNQLKDPIMLIDKNAIYIWRKENLNQPENAKTLKFNEFSFAYNNLATNMAKWKNKESKVVLVWPMDVEPSEESPINSQERITVVFIGARDDINDPKINKAVPANQRIECKTNFLSIARDVEGALK